MPTRQKIVTFGIPTAATATVVLAALLTPWGGTSHPDSPPPAPPPAPAGRPIDVVFAVDTTGSMGGLIDGAKRTVWSIATHIRKSEPNANLRIGLVAYRDVSDDYVTRDFALTTDLDAVFAELSSYEAAGGGDHPEHVAAALDVSLHQMQWRQGAKKIVFVVGDAPPAEREGLRYQDLAREAAGKQVIINTIRAGGSADTARAFEYIAMLANGEFTSIQQDGGVRQIATPYDSKLAELSARVDGTVIIAGDEGVRARHHAKMAAAEAAPAPAKADRASYYATMGSAARTEDDLVGAYGAGGVDPGSLDKDALPGALRGLDQAQLAKELDRRLADRKAAQVEISELVKQRDAYLAGEAKKGEGGTGFDTAVKATVDKQLD